jgi:hypothetical protein
MWRALCQNVRLLRDRVFYATFLAALHKGSNVVNNI